MSKYLTKEQERQLSIALVAVERREVLETLADALQGKTDYTEEYKHLRKKAGAYDFIFWEAIGSLTGKEVGEYCPYDIDIIIEEKLEEALKRIPDYTEEE